MYTSPHANPVRTPGVLFALLLALLTFSAGIPGDSTVFAGVLNATYLGGSGEDAGTDVVCDDQGMVYLTGYTYSADFPSTAGAFSSSFQGSSDVFVTMMSADLGAVISSTFIGDAGWESGRTILAGSSGDIYVAGKTYSSGFPVTAGSYDTTFNGASDMFLLRLSPDLGTLHASTFVGGGSYDDLRASCFDHQGNLLAAGSTESMDFPGTDISGGERATTDVVIIRMSSDLSALFHSAGIGGSADDTGRAIGVNTLQQVVLAGNTESEDFPITQGPYGNGFTGNDPNEVFVAVWAPDLSAILQSTVIGGTSDESCNAVAIDPGGDILVGGMTRSTNYPTTPGAYLRTVYPSTVFRDGFLSRLSMGLDTLIASTYVGWDGHDWIGDLCLDEAGDVMAVGFTRYYPLSYLFPFRMTPDLSMVQGGAFVPFEVSIPLDSRFAVTPDGNGDPVATGLTLGVMPATAGAYDETHNGHYDAFLVKADLDTFQTVTATIEASPPIWPLPYRGLIECDLTNRVEATRHFAGRIDFLMADGTLYSNFRNGLKILDPGEEYSTRWYQNIPALNKLMGENTLQLYVEDVTPPPYNQPPYPPSGGWDSHRDTITGYPAGE